MPHDGARMEAERPPSLAQPPADVHVVAGGSELVVESPDLQQRRPSERHVAAGDVLGFLVGEEDVNRSAGRVGDGLGHRAVARRRDVRAPDADVAGPDEGGGEIPQPVRVGIGVVVGVGDDLARRGAESDVPRVAQAAVLAADHPEAVLLDDVHRPVGGAVVDDDHLEVRVVETPQALAGVADGASPVVGAHDDRDPREPAVPREGRLGHRLPRGGQGGLRPPVAASQTEVPVFDVVAAPMPLVGPGEHERAGRTGGEGRPHLPVERARLPSQAVPAAVQPDLRHDEGPVADQILKPREVGGQALLGLQIHVEAREVEERELEVLRGGIVHVRHQARGILAANRAAQPLEEPLHPAAPVPPDDRRRDLVPDRVHQDRRVAGTAADRRADPLLDGVAPRGLVQEGHVLLPGKADHDPQPVSLGRIEKPARRHRVGAERVEAVGGDGYEIALDLVAGAVLVPVCVRPEGPVRGPAHQQLLVPDEKILAADLGPAQSAYERTFGHGSW